VSIQGFLDAMTDGLVQGRGGEHDLRTHDSDHEDI